MGISHRALCLGAGIAGLAIATVPAIASHGKAGLWSVTVTTDMGGMANMPDMSKLPPEAQAAMRAHGMSMNGHSMTVTHCMTEAEVNADRPPPMRNQKDCRMSNTKWGGNSFSSDFTCSGEMQGKGHVDFAFDSAEHYTAKTTIAGVSGGHPMKVSTAMEGRWMSADCKGLTH